MSLALLGVGAALAVQPGACPPASPGGDAQATVITASPSPELFAAFGHSSLRVSGGPWAETRVLDWGSYSSRAQDPVRDFLAGTLDYELALWGDRRMFARARALDRSLVAQVLQVPPQASAALHAELQKAAAREDRRFRYDWLLDNCATRIRDALDRATAGALGEQLRGAPLTTPRREVLRHLASPAAGPRWWPLWFGGQIVVSTYADQPLDAWQASFMPDRLRLALGRVTLTWPDGQERPLVREECQLRIGGHGFADLEPPRREAPMLGLGFGLAGLVGLGATRARIVAGLALGILALVAGGLGSLAVVLALSSALEGFGSNESWWVASPASLLLLGPALALARGRAGAPSRALAVLLALAGLLGLVRLGAGLTTQDAGAVYAVFLPPLLAAAALLLSRRHLHG